MRGEGGVLLMTRCPRPEQDGDDPSAVYPASRIKRTRATRDAIEQHLPPAELARLKEIEALERAVLMNFIGDLA